MHLQTQSPGVYREEVFLTSEAPLQTGIPVFVGFAESKQQVGLNSDLNGAFHPEPVCLQGKSDFDIYFTPAADSFLAETLTGFFDNGGRKCYVLTAGGAGSREQLLTEAIQRTAVLEEADLIAVPDAMTLRLDDGTPDRAAIRRVQTATFSNPLHPPRLAILDACFGSGPASCSTQARELRLQVQEPIDAALYHPWVGNAFGQWLPPCGHIAGVMARSDDEVGVFKAPANSVLRGVTDLESLLDSSLQSELNAVGVNCIRAFPGRGIRIWGARTLSRDPVYAYVNARRLVISVRREIERQLVATVFESNGPVLWARVQRQLEAYLETLWLAGALYGETPEAAFTVQCDAETNPPEVRERGEMVAEIRMAPAVPAEFVVVRVVRRSGSVETADVD